MTLYSPPRARPTSPWGRRPSVVAAEHQAGYDSRDRHREGHDGARRDPAPFGLPVLGELDELAGVLGDLVEADRRQVSAVIALARHLDADEVAAASGVGVEHWLGVVARATRMDRRLLLRLARLLARLPRLCQAAADGRVSFAQLRGLALALKGLPGELDETVDAWLAEAAAHLAEVDADPDALVEQARAAVQELTREADRQQDEAGLDRRLVLQPRLDGAGGRFYGEEDAYGFAILDAATAPRPEQLDDAGRARADNLQAWLHHACPDDDLRAGSDACRDAASTSEAAGAAPDDLAGAGDAPRTAGTAGAAPADLAGAGDAPTPRQAAEGMPDSARTRIAAGRELVPPQLLVRVDLATLLLLGEHQAPADVLTRLVGGRLSLTSAAARQVVDRAGARIRTVVVDDGEVVGVGRATRVPPGWLTDAVHAVHDTCTGPLCDRPALTADLDHAVPWTPQDGAGPGGPTDLDNLGPLCASTNRDRAATGWQPTQHTRGLRTWRHERTGLTTTSVPATWRPPGRRAGPIDGTGGPPAPPGGSIERTGDPADPTRDPADPQGGPRTSRGRPPHRRSGTPPEADDDSLPF